MVVAATIHYPRYGSVSARMQWRISQPQYRRDSLIPTRISLVQYLSAYLTIQVTLVLDSRRNCFCDGRDSRETNRPAGTNKQTNAACQPASLEPSLRPLRPTPFLTGSILEMHTTRIKILPVLISPLYPPGRLGQRRRLG